MIAISDWHTFMERIAHAANMGFASGGLTCNHSVECLTERQAQRAKALAALVRPELNKTK